MSHIKQHFSLNEEFQLCALTQLQHEDSNQWTWLGRELTSWTDDNSETYDLDEPVKFKRPLVNISANWVLTKHPISVFIPSQHGHVKITLENQELPLATAEQPYIASYVLSNEQIGNIWYDSNLSVDCMPDDEYKTSRFIVNKTPVDPLSSQYVHVGLTKNTSFSISAGFQLDSSKAGISASDGTNVWKLTYDDISAPAQPLAYVNSSGVVQAPFSTQTNMTSKDSLQQIVDEHGIVSAIADYAFYDCDGLSSIDAVTLPNIVSVGTRAFSQCSKLPYMNLSNATYIGPYAFYYCPNLSSIECQKLSSVENSTFSDSGIMSISLPKLGG